MRRPLIKTTPPGPRAQEWINRETGCLSPSLYKEYPAVLEKGQGAWVSDPDGNEFLDFSSGIAVTNTGHCHPEVVRAIKEQADRLLHTCIADFHHQPVISLAEELVKLPPGEGPKRVFFGNSGAEAVEAGIKLARRHSGRKDILAFFGAFHGRTMGALSLTASKTIQKKGFGPFVPGVHHVPYAHCYRCAYNLEYPSCGLACVDFIENELFHSLVPPDEVAAIIIEPMQGEGGYITPPAGYHEKMKALAEKYGILYIVDEIQTGMGRTGKMLCIEHFGIEPDMVTMAKGLASGMPLSALISQKELMDWPPGSHGSTYGGNPLACAAAAASLKLVKEGLAANAAAMGARMRLGLEELRAEHECMGDIRGLGLMLAVEFVKDRASKAPDKELRNRMLRRCFEKGLMLLSCGDSVIRFCAPLIVNPDEVQVGLEIFADTLKELRG